MDYEAVLRGEVTPMFFASAMSNFGVELFLKYVVVVMNYVISFLVDSFILEYISTPKGSSLIMLPVLGQRRHGLVTV